MEFQNMSKIEPICSFRFINVRRIRPIFLKSKWSERIRIII
uniref:ORF40v n=1 Tax=Pinus koraiensis TaxID=88728 RepID=A4QMD6_PINKO|nr:ORF40v [Pinus koraiensis]ABP35473.1 ORF40v [Pinus koraiensis]